VPISALRDPLARKKRKREGRPSRRKTGGRQGEDRLNVFGEGDREDQGVLGTVTKIPARGQGGCIADVRGATPQRKTALYGNVSGGERRVRVTSDLKKRKSSRSSTLGGRSFSPQATVAQSRQRLKKSRP